MYRPARRRNDCSGCAGEAWLEDGSSAPQKPTTPAGACLVSASDAGRKRVLTLRLCFQDDEARALTGVAAAAFDRSGTNLLESSAQRVESRTPLGQPHLLWLL